MSLLNKLDLKSEDILRHPSVIEVVDFYTDTNYTKNVDIVNGSNSGECNMKKTNNVCVNIDTPNSYYPW